MRPSHHHRLHLVMLDFVVACHSQRFGEAGPRSISSSVHSMRICGLCAVDLRGQGAVVQEEGLGKMMRAQQQSCGEVDIRSTGAMA